MVQWGVFFNSLLLVVNELEKNKILSELFNGLLRFLLCTLNLKMTC